MTGHQIRGNEARNSPAMKKPKSIQIEESTRISQQTYKNALIFRTVPDNGQ
jgi:hypothetical protein